MMPRRAWSGKKPARQKVPLSVEELEQRTLLSTISSAAYSLLGDRVEANPAAFFVYQDGDSGLNHGFASGKFASNNDSTIINGIMVNTAAVYDPTSATGSTSDPNALDRVRGNVLQITFPKLSSGQFTGLNIQEPEDDPTRGNGYDLRGATQVVFDAASPTAGGLKVQFGVGGKVTDSSHFYPLTGTFTPISIPLNSLRDPATNAVSPPDLSSVHILFAVATNNVNASGGGTVLLDNVRFEPVPPSHLGVPSLPIDTQTFGVVPVVSDPVNQPIPPDQANRNVAAIYGTSLTELGLLNRGTPADLANAHELADTLVYALNNDIKGDGMPGHGHPIPTAPDGSVGLHSGYSGGDLPLFNDQFDPKTMQFDRGLQGQTRLAGFTGPPIPPDTTPGFYLVLDGATGGNNAFAILALAAAYRQFRDIPYLDAARKIGEWIVGNLTDTSPTGYGGYFVGYRDGTLEKLTGKSTENNADIFAAFTELAAIETSLGNSGEAANWTAEANVAGDFVMAMYDSTMGRFYAGTVPADMNPGPGPGFDPTGPQQGNDIINKFDFLDSDSFTTLALASSPRYRNQIDWHGPVQYIVSHFAQTITAGGQTFQGFDIVTQPTATPNDNRNTPGPNGIAWEFTGQAVETMRFVDDLYRDTRFESLADFYLGQIGHAQTSAPFADGRGLVDATVQDGDRLAPLNQGLTTPFQFIPERVGLPATTWAVLADQVNNPLAPRFLARPRVTGVSPSTGPTGGGTTMTITGTNLSGATAVSFGGTAASFTVLSATQITATAPAGATGSVAVTVTSAGGTSIMSSEDLFTYIPPPPPLPPSVTSIVGAHSHHHLISLTVGFDEALNPDSALNPRNYRVLGGVRRHHKVIYRKVLRIRNPVYAPGTDTVVLKLAKPYRGSVQVTVESGVVAADGASSSSTFTMTVG
jgi:hypothetical protein